MRYPEGNVVGILDNLDQLESAIIALTGNGFLQSEIDVACGEAAAERLAANTGRSGLADLAMRIVTALGMPDDETIVKAGYEQALRDGHFVVLALAPTEERKELAAKLLAEHGGHSVNFLGRSTIEKMMRGRAAP